MYLSEHLALPSEATLSQTSKLDGVRKLSIHLRRGLALGSGPDEKFASDFTSVPDPSARRICGGGRAQWSWGQVVNESFCVRTSMRSFVNVY